MSGVVVFSVVVRDAFVTVAIFRRLAGVRVLEWEVAGDVFVGAFGGAREVGSSFSGGFGGSM